MLCVSSFAVTTSADETLLTTDKTEYNLNEPIMVTAKGSGKDWVGIYRPGDTASLYWAYIDVNADEGIGSGVAFDIKNAPKKKSSAPSTLPAGEYIIRLMPNDTSDLSKQLASINIKIKASADEPTVPASGGDLTRLSVSKTEYEYSEKITVSAIGSGKDWVGIYYPGAAHSIYWTYIDKSASNGVGSGVEFDIREAANKKSDSPSKLPAGKYVIRLMPNDSENIADTIAWVEIVIKTFDPNTAPKPEKPLSAEYKLANNTDGFSEGVLTVKVSKDNAAKDVVCYWADANGKLKSYTALAKFKITGETTTKIIPACTIIPEGATKLLVYTAIEGVMSDECVEVKLPEGAASTTVGNPLFEFQVVSDIHITNDQNHRNNKQFVEMLRDIVKISPNSVGLFISGDIANSGNKQEYENFVKLHESVIGAPAYYMAIGNHDLYNGSLADKTAQFLSYAKLPDGKNPESVHYDFWLNGYHYVFLGNDKLVNNVRVTLNDETLEWLNETLAEDRNVNRPTFVFLHQSIYDTVSGSLPGQGWDGVENFAKFKKVLSNYPEVIMFNGHSHWTLDSERCMYERNDSLPTIFNTASVAYLWTSYDITKGENLDGSQGYYVRVYEEMIEVLGRDFITGEWVSSAQFRISTKLANEEPGEITSGSMSETTNAPETSAPPADVTTEKPGDEKGCGGLIGIGAVIAAVIVGIGAVIIRKKED